MKGPPCRNTYLWPRSCIWFPTVYARIYVQLVSPIPPINPELPVPTRLELPWHRLGTDCAYIVVAANSVATHSISNLDLKGADTSRRPTSVIWSHVYHYGWDITDATTARSGLNREMLSTTDVPTDSPVHERGGQKKGIKGRGSAAKPPPGAEASQGETTCCIKELVTKLRH